MDPKDLIIQKQEEIIRRYEAILTDVFNYKIQKGSYSEQLKEELSALRSRLQPAQIDMQKEEYNPPKIILNGILKTRVYCYDPKYGYGCDECCNGDRCDTPYHRDRKGCPHCNGTGWIPIKQPAQIVTNIEINEAANDYANNESGYNDRQNSFFSFKRGVKWLRSRLQPAQTDEDCTRNLLADIISWELDLSQYSSLESILQATYHIKKRDGAKSPTKEEVNKILASCTQVPDEQENNK